MLNSADLVRDGALLPDAIAAAAGDAGVVAALAAAPTDGVHCAALALAAGAGKITTAQKHLLALLDRDGVAGQAAAWALAQLDSEAAVIAAIEAGGLDIRTNGYYSLAIRAALGTASAQLAPAMTARVASELARVKQKLTGLGEQALKVLAILGTPGTDTLIQQVLENDPFTDKFELQRLRKAVADGGRDRDSIAAYKSPWATLFADQCYREPAPAPEAKPVPAAKAAPVAKASPPKTAPMAKAPPPAPKADEAMDAVADDGELPEEGPAAQPFDWAAFAASEEALALPPAVKDLAGKLGPLLEQLAVRAVNAPLTDLSGQEFVGLLLQVLPQALPPQHVQAALSPQALHGYQALAKYLTRTGLATHGEELIEGVKFVREQLKAQIRKTGMLGGPDYSDPDEKITGSQT